MSDKPNNVGAEEIAHRLLIHIAYAEAKSLGSTATGERPNREWILQTYAECLRIVQNPHLQE